MNSVTLSVSKGASEAPYSALPRLRDVFVGERPQERLQRFGPSALSDTELLALLLRKGDSQQDILSLVTRLLMQMGGLPGLLSISREELEQCRGIGPVKAAQLLAVCELSRRLILARGEEPVSFDTPDRVFQFFTPKILGLEVEKFWVLCLNRKNALLRCAEITSGTVSASLIHPREVFRESIRLGASAVIAVHNHPSGDPRPSAADIRATRQLRESAKIIDIDFLDHIIVGRTEADPAHVGYYSFNEAGLM
jgi:DNA repair protein RadC